MASREPQPGGWVCRRYREKILKPWKSQSAQRLTGPEAVEYMRVGNRGPEMASRTGYRRDALTPRGCCGRRNRPISGSAAHKREVSHVFARLTGMTCLLLLSASGCALTCGRPEQVLLGSLEGQNRILASTVVIRGEWPSILVAYPRRNHGPTSEPAENPAALFHLKIVEHGTGSIAVEKNVQQGDMQPTNWREPDTSYLVANGSECSSMVQGKEYDIAFDVEGRPERAKIDVFVCWIVHE